MDPSWRLLLTADQIAEKNKILATQLNEYFKDSKIIVVSIFKGALYFTADLCRLLKMPLTHYIIHASSYQDVQTRSQEVRILEQLEPEKFKNRQILILDELCDEGNTLIAVSNAIKNISKERIITCTMFKKNKYNKYTPDLYGFDVPDVWLVGYGLDDCQEKRNWPFLVACPKDPSIPASLDDKLFTDHMYYNIVLKQMTK